MRHQFKLYGQLALLKAIDVFVLSFRKYYPNFGNIRAEHYNINFKNARINKQKEQVSG